MDVVPAAHDHVEARASGDLLERKRITTPIGRWCAKLRSQVEAEGVGELYPAAAALLDGFVELDRSLLGSPAPPAPAGP